MDRDAWERMIRDRHLTQRVVAERAGMPRSTLAGIVAGHQGTTEDTARRIAAAVPCKARQLFPGLPQR